METIRLRAHVGEDGLLRVEAPVPTPNADYDIVVVYAIHETSEPDSWRVFIDETYGSLADDPIERPPELTLDIRDSIE